MTAPRLLYLVWVLFPPLGILSAVPGLIFASPGGADAEVNPIGFALSALALLGTSAAYSFVIREAESRWADQTPTPWWLYMISLFSTSILSTLYVLFAYNECMRVFAGSPSASFLDNMAVVPQVITVCIIVGGYFALCFVIPYLFRTAYDRLSPDTPEPREEDTLSTHVSAPTAVAAPSPPKRKVDLIDEVVNDVDTLISSRRGGAMALERQLHAAHTRCAR